MARAGDTGVLPQPLTVGSEGLSSQHSWSGEQPGAEAPGGRQCAEQLKGQRE